MCRKSGLFRLKKKNNKNKKKRPTESQEIFTNDFIAFNPF